MLFKQGCPQPLIDSTIRHYSLWSAFFPVCSKVELWIAALQHSTAWVHIPTPTGSILDASEIWITIFNLVHSLVVIVTICDLEYLPPQCYIILRGWMLFSCGRNHLRSGVLCPLNVTSFWGGGCCLVVVVTTWDLVYFDPSMLHHFEGVDAV